MKLCVTLLLVAASLATMAKAVDDDSSWTPPTLTDWENGWTDLVNDDRMADVPLPLFFRRDDGMRVMAGEEIDTEKVCLN